MCLCVCVSACVRVHVCAYVFLYDIPTFILLAAAAFTHIAEPITIRHILRMLDWLCYTGTHTLRNTINTQTHAHNTTQYNAYAYL